MHHFLLKEKPKEAEIISHQLMLRAGLICQLASGIYNWLPLGVKILNQISGIIRSQLDQAGFEEILMPLTQPAKLWLESGRYDAYGPEMLRFNDRKENAFLFGPTNEEVVTDIFRRYFKSHKSLPLNLYQIQWKFREDIRPRFGVMRGREFLMKDAYSFDLNQDSARATYQKYFATYLKIFQALGLEAIPMQADNGAIGGELSHEFQILADTGESEVFYEEALLEKIKAGIFTYDQLKNYYAATSEKHQPELSKKLKLKSKRGIEVGHIFNFGTKYSQAMKALIADDKGVMIPVNMGSYGIGVSRLVAAIIEASHDDKGIIWPKMVSPYQVIMVNLTPKNQAVNQLAKTLIELLKQAKITFFHDQAPISIGQKLASADLLGFPKQIILGAKDLEQGVITVKDRKTADKQKIKIANLTNLVDLIK